MFLFIGSDNPVLVFAEGREMLGEFCEFLLKPRSFCGATKNFTADHPFGGTMRVRECLLDSLP
jgi:hypothetical protein